MTQTFLTSSLVFYFMTHTLGVEQVIEPCYMLYKM
jgi:hypothetical protein